MKGNSKRGRWASRLDNLCTVLAALVPTGLVIGNVAFESMIVLVGLCWIARTVVSKENPLQHLTGHPMLIPWLAWFCCIMLSLLWNGPGSKGWVHDFVLIRYFIFLMALVDISDRLPVCKYLLAGLAVSVIWAALDILLVHLIGYDLIGRSSVRYADKVQLGRMSSIAVYAAPFFMVWAITDKSLALKKRWLCAVVGLLAFLEVLYSGVRSAAVASVIGFLFAGLCLLPKQRRLLMATTAMVCCALGAVLYYQTTSEIELQSMYHRIYIWKIAWAMWSKQPVFGVGVSGWQDVFNDLTAKGGISFVAPGGNIFVNMSGYHAHNLLLMILSATGLIGLAAFSWLFLQTINLVIRNKTGWRFGLATWIVVFLVVGLAGWNIYASQYQVLFAYLMALTGTSVPQKYSDIRTRPLP